MPNAPKTPTRTVRISDELWEAALTKARAQEITVTSVIVSALEEFISEDLTN